MARAGCFVSQPACIAACVYRRLNIIDPIRRLRIIARVYKVRALLLTITSFSRKYVFLSIDSFVAYKTCRQDRFPNREPLRSYLETWRTYIQGFRKCGEYVEAAAQGVSPRGSVSCLSIA